MTVVITSYFPLFGQFYEISKTGFNHEASGRELESYQEILSFTFAILHQDMQTQYCLCKAGLSTHIYCPAPQQQPNITLWRWPDSDECLKARCSLAETVKCKR